MDESFVIGKQQTEINAEPNKKGKTEIRPNFVDRLSVGIQRLAKDTGSRIRPPLAATSALPNGSVPAPVPLSRPSLQPSRGVTFTVDTTPDLRVRLRELVRMTAQIIHTGFGISAADDGATSLLQNDNKPVILFLDQARPIAEQLHAEARSQLMDTYLNAAEQLRIDRIFRSIGDILSALQGAETAIVAMRLLRQQSRLQTTGSHSTGERVVYEIACRTDILARKTAQALSHAGDPNAAIDAAMTIRNVRALFGEGDRSLRQSPESHRTPVTESIVQFASLEHHRRICRAALWSLIICAESMARVAARFAMTAEEQATLSSARDTDNSTTSIYHPTSRSHAQYRGFSDPTIDTR